MFQTQPNAVPPRHLHYSSVKAWATNQGTQRRFKDFPFILKIGILGSVERSWLVAWPVKEKNVDFGLLVRSCPRILRNTIKPLLTSKYIWPQLTKALETPRSTEKQMTEIVMIELPTGLQNEKWFLFWDWRINGQAELDCTRAWKQVGLCSKTQAA